VDPSTLGMLVDWIAAHSGAIATITTTGGAAWFGARSRLVVLERRVEALTSKCFGPGPLQCERRDPPPPLTELTSKR
jgi:hypothetical protein